MDLAANLTFLWPEVASPYDRFTLAADAGFAAVERLVLHDLDVDVVAAQLVDLRLRLVLFDPYPGRWDDGERGLLCLPDRGDELERSTSEALAVADRLGVRLLNVLLGIVPVGTSRRRCIDLVVERLRRLAPAAAAAGVSLLVEAINEQDVPGYLVSDVREAAAVVRAVDHPSVGLLYDAYHVAMGGLDPGHELAAVADLVRHVQVADAPGRHEPGTGTIDFGGLVHELTVAGYAGAIGLELHPSGATEEAVAAAREHLRLL